MRLASGVTDQYIYFVAVDATDLKTRETGLSTFTVYRSRDGGAAAAYTTPTVNETDTTNMPGVYELLVDEDTTIAAGNDTEEMVLHITATGMAPVTRTIELYRPKITAGNTLGVAADGDISGNVDGTVATVTTVTNQVTANVTAISGDSVAADNLELDYDGTGYNKSNSTIGTTTTNTDMVSEPPTAAAVADAVWDESTTGHTTAGTFGEQLKTDVDAILADTNELQTDDVPGLIAALNDLSAAQVNTEVDTALADIHLDHLLSVDYDPASKPGIATALLNELVENDGGVSRFTSNALENAPGGSAPTAAAIADAVWDEARADHQAAGSFGQSLQVIRTGTAQAGAASTITLDASASASNSFYNNTIVHIIAGTGANQSRLISSYVGSTKVATVRNSWVTNPSSDSVFVIRPGAERSASLSTNSIAAVADAIWDEATSGHTTGGTFGEQLKTDVDAILVDTNSLNDTKIPDTISLANINAEVDTAFNTAIPGSPTANSINERIAAIDDKLPTGTISDLTTSEVNTEVSDVLKVDTIAEMAQAAPPATPTFEEALMYMYMALRNKLDVTSGVMEFHDDAGTVIWKKTVSDDATTYTEAEGVSGP